MAQIHSRFHSTFKDLSNESSHTPKSNLKRRSYDPDKLEKKNWLLSRKNVATEPTIRSEC